MNNLIKLIETLVQIWIFIDDSAILSNIVSSIFIGGIIIYIFRIPSFKLNIYAKLRQQVGSIFFDLRNNKNFVAYDENSVFYKLYIPEKLFLGQHNLNFKRSTIKGWYKWDPIFNFRDKDRFDVLGDRYILINGVSELPIFPNQGVTLFKINGIFLNKSRKYRIYYQLRTKNGFYPYIIIGGYHNWFIKFFRGKHNDFLNKLLPSVDLIIS